MKTSILLSLTWALSACAPQLKPGSETYTADFSCDGALDRATSTAFFMTVWTNDTEHGGAAVSFEGSAEPSGGGYHALNLAVSGCEQQAAPGWRRSCCGLSLTRSRPTHTPKTTTSDPPDRPGV